MAHEFGDHVQDELKKQFNLPGFQVGDRRKKLLADCFSGVGAYTALYNGYLEERQRRRGRSSAGGYRQSGVSRNPHASPDERAAAFMLDHNTGAPVQRITSYWSDGTFKQRSSEDFADSGTKGALMIKANHDQKLGVNDWVTAITIIIFFSASTLIIGRIGVEDIFDDSTYGVRVRAAAMIVVASYLLISAWAMVRVLRNWSVLRKWSAKAGAVALIGGTVSAVTGAILLAYQSALGDYYTPWLWVWLGMAFLGAFVTWRLWQAGARFPYPKQFAVAAIVGSLLTGANFAYTSLYQPTAQPAQLKLEAEIRTPAFNAGKNRASIPIAVSVVNNGKVGLYLVGVTYSVLGRLGEFSATARTMEEMNRDIGNGYPASKWTAVKGYQLVNGDMVLPGVTLNPDDRRDVIRTVDLPVPTEYDVIELKTTALVISLGDTHVKSMTKEKPLSISLNGTRSGKPLAGSAGQPPHFAGYEIEIRETSHLRERIRWKWKASLRCFHGTSNGFYLQYVFRPEWSPLTIEKAFTDINDKDPKNDKPILKATDEAGKRYGVVFSEAVWEKSAYEMKLKDPPMR